jgi:hypothetical protein
MVIPEKVLDTLPPVLRIALSQKLPSGHAAARQFLRKLVPELERQAEWTLANFRYESAQDDSDRLSICVSPELNPFIEDGKCGQWECRQLIAQQIGRTIGLYADRAIVSDPLTGTLAHHEGRWTNSQLDNLLEELAVAHSLEPLIAAGLFHFSEPTLPVCRACARTQLPGLEEISATLAERFPVSYTFDPRAKSFHVDMEPLGRAAYQFVDLHNDELALLKSGMSIDDLFKGVVYPKVIAGEVLDGLLAFQVAARSGSIAISASPITVIAARQIEGRQTPVTAEWELDRTATLPWISNLTMTQIVRLRDEAATALPQFRARLAHLLSGEQSTDRAATMLDLRAEASSVENELSTVSRKRLGLHAAIAAAGIAVAAYGVATAGSAIGLTAGGGATALLELLASIHTTGQHKAIDRETIKTKPGYILLKAKQILAHTKSKHHRQTS